MESPPPSRRDHAFQPYAPPVHEAPRGDMAVAVLPERSIALYTPDHVGLATFLGTLLGGSIVYAINERRLGRPQAATHAIIVGVVGAVVMAGIGFALPSNFPSFPLGIVALFGSRAIARRRQGGLVQAHFAAGGKRASGWVAAGIGLACLVVVLVPIFAIAFLTAFLQSR